MAIKTFSVGELATSADVNTYLANAGLVYVTSVVVGSAISTLTIPNCFNSTYDNYPDKILTISGHFVTLADVPPQTNLFTRR